MTSNPNLGSGMTMNEQPPVHARWWVRINLIVVVLILLAVFATAIWIHPYDSDGNPRRMQTHTQLGLDPCEFVSMTGRPCPACGLTTSFAFLVRGDILNSLRANFVGTVLAVFCAFALGWSLWVAIRGRYLWIQSIERTLLWIVGGFSLVLLIRWIVVAWL